MILQSKWFWEKDLSGHILDTHNSQSYLATLVCSVLIFGAELVLVEVALEVTAAARPPKPSMALRNPHKA